MDHNDCSKTPLLKKKLGQAINMIVAETEDEELDAKRTTNNETMDTFTQPTVTTNTPREKTNVADERWIFSDSLTETLKVFNILTLQSTINDSADDHSKKKLRKRFKKRFIGSYLH